MQAVGLEYLNTPLDINNQANVHIKYIKFFYVDIEKCVNNVNIRILEKRYSLVNEFYGIRNHHSFKPINLNSFEMRRTSNDNIIISLNIYL